MAEIPLRLLGAARQLIGADRKIWAKVRTRRMQMRDQWPGWCWCPLPTFMNSNLFIGPWPARVLAMPKDQILSLTGDLYNLFAWSETRTAYCFNDVLWRELYDGGITEQIPVALLKRMPAPCVYISGAPIPEISGFFVQVYQGKESLVMVISAVSEARFVSRQWGPGCALPQNSPLRRMFTTIIPIGENATLNNVIVQMMREIRRPLDREWGASHPELYMSEAELAQQALDEGEMACYLLQFVLPHVLYLCTSAPDISERRPTKRGKNAPTSRCRFVSRTFDVGARVGAQLRLARQESNPSASSGGGGRPPRPHVRRAHWHLYWTGKGRAVPRLNWVAPTLVNASSPADVPAVLRGVDEHTQPEDR